MRRYRAVPAVIFAVLVSALVGGFFGKSALAIDDKAPDHFKTSAALEAIESASWKDGGRRPVQFGPRHTQDARPASTC
jgi:hypothetical protein